MKRLLLLCCMSLRTPLGAQDALFLNQRILLHYAQWDQGVGRSEDTQGTYDFNLGLPVLTYRLGALALTGDMNYDHPAGSASRPSTFGLDRYGLGMTLFPYRPFHLSLDFNRTQTPAVAGQDRAVGTSWGVGLNYRGRRVQDLEVSMRQGGLVDGQERADWSLWNLAARQLTGRTQVAVQLSRGASGGTGATPSWHSTDLLATTDTRFSRVWALRSDLHLQEGLGSHTTSADLNLTGTPGTWTSLSELNLEQSQSGGPTTRSETASQSLALTRDRWSAFSGLAMGLSQSPGGTGNLSQGMALLGAAYHLGRGWQVSADLGQSLGTRAADPGASPVAAYTGNTHTLHAGISQGGNLPDVLRHALFFFSDRAFQQRVVEEYPPGYVPTELAAEMARRRFQQMGSFSFTTDLWRQQADGGPEHTDWARVTGQVRVNSGLTVQLMGDWKTDQGLSLMGQRMDSRDVNLNGSYSFGASQMVTSAGYGRTAQSPLPGFQAVSPESANPASHYLSGGFNSRIWLIPYGVQWVRYETSTQPAGQAFMGYFLLNFRQVNLRVTYQSVHRGNGLRDNRLTVDLLRWMDTLAFGGGGF